MRKWLLFFIVIVILAFAIFFTARWNSSFTGFATSETESKKAAEQIALHKFKENMKKDLEEMDALTQENLILLENAEVEYSYENIDRWDVYIRVPGRDDLVKVIIE